MAFLVSSDIEWLKVLAIDGVGDVQDENYLVVKVLSSRIQSMIGRSELRRSSILTQLKDPQLARHILTRERTWH